jgi:hypothetical protein
MKNIRSRLKSIGDCPFIKMLSAGPMQKLLESLGASLLRSHDISLHGPLETTASVPGGEGGGEGRENMERNGGIGTIERECF